MNAITVIVVGVLIFLFGVFIGILVSKRSLKLSALGTVMIESDDNPENMYMVWNMELEDVLKKQMGLVQIKKFDSQNKQRLL